MEDTAQEQDDEPDETILLPLTSLDSTITVGQSKEGYVIRDNERGEERAMPLSDREHLFPDLSRYVDEYGDSVPIIAPEPLIPWHTPGTPAFNRRLAQDVREDPERYRHHYFGMTAGIGLRHLVSWTERDNLMTQDP